MGTRASRDNSPRSKSPFNTMQSKQSTSALGVNALPTTSEQRILPNIFKLQFRPSNTTFLSRFRRLTPPFLHSFSVLHAQMFPRIHNNPFPLTRPLRLRVVRRPKNHLSTCYKRRLRASRARIRRLLRVRQSHSCMPRIPPRDIDEPRI
jgi:hypothetical protein